MGTQKIRVLAVDGSALMRKFLREILGDAGDFEVYAVRDGQAALDVLSSFKPDVIAINAATPQLDGVSCSARIMAVSQKPIIMISSPSAKVEVAVNPAGAAVACSDVKAGSRSPALRESVTHLATKLRMAARSRSVPAARSMQVPASAPAGVVLIGVSTGGPRTLELILPYLPADFPWPVLIAQHMPANFTGAFARRLDRICEVSVEEVSVPVALRPGCAYVARGEADVVVKLNGSAPSAMSTPSDPGTLWHPSVTRMVESAMASLEPDRLIGVMLTGMGNDGSLAMAEMHKRGARTIAEDSSTAVVFGMPGELIKHGGAGVILPANRIAQKLVDWLKHSLVRSFEC